MTTDGPAIDHVTIAAADLAASLAFYDGALGALALVRVAELVDEEDVADVEAVGWGRPHEPALLWVVSAPPATTGLHLRLRAHSRAEVETFFAEAVDSGGVGRSTPRPWILYRRGEFGATVADPAGNLIEVVTDE